MKLSALLPGNVLESLRTAALLLSEVTAVLSLLTVAAVSSSSASDLPNHSMHLRDDDNNAFLTASRK